MKIYLACPLTKGDVQTNVKRAIEIGDKIASMGHTLFNPALTYYWNKECPHEYEFWMQQDFEWVRTCDALFRIPGESAGADREVELAKSLGKPVYYNLEDVPVEDPQVYTARGGY